MAKLQVSELRNKTAGELNEVLLGLQKDRFNYRMQQSTGQLSQSHLLAGVRKDIARVKTLIGEKAGS
jgi:large subunit ribosomal protein L29